MLELTGAVALLAHYIYAASLADFPKPFKNMLDLFPKTNLGTIIKPIQEMIKEEKITETQFISLVKNTLSAGHGKNIDFNEPMFFSHPGPARKKQKNFPRFCITLMRNTGLQLQRQRVGSIKLLLME